MLIIEIGLPLYGCSENSCRRGDFRACYLVIHIQWLDSNTASAIEKVKYGLVLKLLQIQFDSFSKFVQLG